MRRLVFGIVVLLIGLGLPAQAGDKACFDPAAYAGELKAGFKACEKSAGCETCAQDSGAAYGLCIAYCEAMDCDSVEPAATEAACEDIEYSYTQMTGKSFLPCELGFGSLDPAFCGAFAACAECFDSAWPDSCELCTEDLIEYGCINVCEP